jgi:hypothetical protein
VPDDNLPHPSCSCYTLLAGRAPARRTLQPALSDPACSAEPTRQSGPSPSPPHSVACRCAQSLEYSPLSGHTRREDQRTDLGLSPPRCCPGMHSEHGPTQPPENAQVGGRPPLMHCTLTWPLMLVTRIVTRTILPVISALCISRTAARTARNVPVVLTSRIRRKVSTG